MVREGDRGGGEEEGPTRQKEKDVRIHLMDTKMEWFLPRMVQFSVTEM